MKTKCSFILKSSIALLLAVLMLFGSLSTVLAATVDMAETGATVDNLNRVKFHANLTGYTGSGASMSAWSNQSLSKADSNHYYGTFYTAASQSQKQFGWNVGGSDWGDSWCTMNGEHFTAQQTYEKTKDMTFNGSNDKVSTIAATSGWVKLQIDWYGSYSNSSYVKFYQTAVTALSSSVSAGSTTLTTGSTTTITPSSSGGTGTPTNSVKVYQGSASGTDVTSSVLSGTTFTAPNVASTTKYYVINTATDPTIKSYTKASSATQITVNPASTTYNNIAVAAKYSTTGADNSYTTNMASGSATISANSYTTGSSALNISADTVSGYTFYKWVVTAGSGSIASATTANTTFTPSASNTTVTAQYKKIFTITSSVDSTGTGAGTVTTSKTSVEAGGSYTITATAKDGSAVESVKVNDTAKTATASQTISSVSADQTVVVKFKSNVKLKGSMNPTAWSGEVMTAADKSVASYSITKELAANTTYSFKHFVETNTWSTTVDSWNLNNVATHSTADDNNGGTNLTITPSVKVNVTFTSDGSKFTSITAVPADATKYNVTFKKAANTTITGEYMGTAFTTASADAVVSVYKGTDISFKVTAAIGYYINDLTSGTTPEFGPGESKTYTLSNVTEEKTITPTAAANPTFTAKTNKSDYGTVSITTNSIVPGSTFEIKVSPKSGQLTNLSYEVNGSGALHQTVTLYPKSGGSNSAPASVGALAELFGVSKLNSNKVDLAATGEDTTYTSEVVPNNTTSITVNATFSAYSAESNYYYNYYSNSGKGTSSQMTEGMINGATFSYYHVTDRSEDDQLFTVSKKTEASGSYVYFTTDTSNDWKMTYGGYQPTAYFFNAQGSVGTAFPGSKMTWSKGSDDNQNKDWKFEIPSGATSVIFTNGKSGSAQKQTVDLTLADGNGCYVVGNYDNSSDRYNCTQWATPASDAGTGMHEQEWFSTQDDKDIYPGTYSAYTGAGLLNDHGLSSVRVAKPKGDNFTNSKTDYYIVLFYPDITYSIGGSEFTPLNNPLVYWMSELPGGTDDNVTIYAKDGSIRSDTNGSTYANIADTKIYLNNTVVGTNHSGNITNQTYQTYKATKGETVVIKTQIGATDSGTLSNSADLIAKYYVRGFCINGEVTELLSWKADGLYTLTYKIPEDTEITKFEITPIYYLKDTEANQIVTYRVTGFTDELKQVGAGKPNWGNTLYTYPFYGKLGGQNNAFGAYPGQPMVYYKGQYQMQIPQKSTAWDLYNADATTVNNTPVSGVTMSNGYWDSVHRQIMGYGNNSTSADHVQTYDYGDFYKIFNEKKPVDNIVFDFKYRTKKHNFENQPVASTTKSTLDTNYGTNGNGFELLTNFHGRNVDLFGTPLSGDAADPSKTTPVYVVSIGGVNETAHTGVENIAGYYATEWMVYGSSDGTNYTRVEAGSGTSKKSSIPPEVLVLNDDNDTSFNTTTYPSADANHDITNWKALYTALEAYRGKPVMISYEAADAQQGQSMFYAGTGGATRNDGRWLYSKNGENITSNIKIQYSDDNGVTYYDLDKTTPQVNGLSAYFTNDGVEGQMTYSTTIDPDKTFDFEAKTTNGNYKFVGWYMEDGTKITSDNASHTERSGSYTFVAKFMQVQSGQLILSHSVDTDTTYKGAGTAKISAVVKDGEEVIRTYDLTTSDITLDDKIIKSDSTYTIDVTLEATATGSDVLGPTVLANPSGQDATYFNSASTTTEDKTKTIVLNSFTVASLFSGTTQNVKNIIYHSYFTQAVFHYKLKFEYKDRFGNDKVFYRDGNLTSAQAANENYVERVENGSYSTRYLRPAFIETIAPHVSNFGEDITWNLQERTFSFTVNNYYYNCDHYITATTTGNNKRNVTFKLPYEHTNGIATGGNSGTAATTKDFELIGDNAVTFDTIPVLLNGDENGIYTEEGKKNWIAAPATLSDNGITKYFQYWSVKNTDADGDTDPEVARCYFQGFNFVALDNYTVTPIYDVSPTDITESGIYTGVSFLETSRNQWNTNENSAKTATATASDLLYNDFVLNYNFNGVDIYKGNSDSNDIQELGVVVERVQELGINQDGSKDTEISHYTSLATDIENVLAAANTEATDGQATYKVAGTKKPFYKQVVDKTSLDNKNRIKFYDAFYNGAGWNFEKQTSAAKYTYKNYVYRAYTYIKYTDQNGETQIKLADAPAYFTMYDEATATYEAPKSTTSGN